MMLLFAEYFESGKAKWCILTFFNTKVGN